MTIDACKGFQQKEATNAALKKIKYILCNNQTSQLPKKLPGTDKQRTKKQKRLAVHMNNVQISKAINHNVTYDKLHIDLTAPKQTSIVIHFIDMR